MQFLLPLIAILTVISAWRFWRRSPLYSVKITIKVFGVFLLIVGAIVGLTLVVVSGPMKLSPVAQAASALFGVMSLATAATGIIIRLTDSHVAQLPAAIQLVTIHRRKVHRWIWRTVIYEVVNVAAALLLPSLWKWLPLLLGGLILVMGGPILIGFYMRARRLDLGMSQVVAKPWVHWEHTQEQWEGWAKNQLETERAKPGQFTVRVSVILFLMCAVLFGAGAAVSGGSRQENFAVVGGMLGFVLILLLVANWFNRTNFGRRYRRLLAAPRETYFGDEGLFCNGEYVAWILSGSFLLEATTATDPPARLVLIFQTYSGSNAVSVARRILVPQDRWADVELLQKKLYARCPKAFIHMVKPEAKGTAT
jgi:hypothetical protein